MSELSEPCSSHFVSALSLPRCLDLNISQVPNAIWPLAHHGLCPLLRFHRANCAIYVGPFALFLDELNPRSPQIHQDSLHCPRHDVFSVFEFFARVTIAVSRHLVNRPIAPQCIASLSRSRQATQVNLSVPNFLSHRHAGSPRIFQPSKHT
ncbi:hypothetical protein ARMSODRAFT_480695 [Armillaria solidipes]|uniref:Uncharacterized protein n=1 Tax=Armillaria solidipes TaxID=1076256 RepID=A0A2H3BUU0_9AGAR|nr:hypothetical protein ARMSODRAFT_480695 [Armillaria solidipes]